MAKGKAPTGRQDFSRLIAMRDKLLPEDLSGVSFEVDRAGELWATQHAKRGTTPRIRVRSYPFSIDVASPTGGTYSIEVRFFGSDTTAIAPLSSAFQLAGGSKICLPGDFFCFSKEEC